MGVVNTITAGSPMNPFTHPILRTTVLTVCVSIMPQLFFKNGFLLAYFLELGLNSADVLILLSLPSLIMLILLVPFAYYADLYGKKRIGQMGIFLTITGFGLITAAGLFDTQVAARYITSGILLFSIGLSALFSGWFALLTPLIPKEIRGRFFGTMRVSWQIFAICCSFILTYILEKSSDITTYQAILIFFTSLLVLQFRLYTSIPEKHKKPASRQPLLSIIGSISDLPGYMPFCAYCFLLMLATGAWPATLGLLEKNVLAFSDDAIVHMGTMLFAGAMLGFFLGGRSVDRYGTKNVFLMVHFLYFVLLSLVLFRDAVPASHLVYYSIITFGLGAVQAGSTIAITSEMISLAPPENTSVVTSLCMSLQWGGAALSGLLSGKLIQYGILAETWQLNGLTMSRYDSLILFYAVLVLVFTTALGLIPSVVKRRRGFRDGDSAKTV
ncbi:MAG: MFS transporter [Desulfobacterales bacterium]|nr:MFS transporter [Desulfobacterales bacterium]